MSNDNKKKKNSPLAPLHEDPWPWAISGLAYMCRLIFQLSFVLPGISSDKTKIDPNPNSELHTTSSTEQTANDSSWIELRFYIKFYSKTNFCLWGYSIGPDLHKFLTNRIKLLYEERFNPLYKSPNVIIRFKHVLIELPPKKV